MRRKYRISGLTSQPTRELMYTSCIVPSHILFFRFFLTIFFPWVCYIFLSSTSYSFPADEDKNMELVVEYFQEMYGYKSWKSEDGELFANGGAL